MEGIQISFEYCDHTSQLEPNNRYYRFELIKIQDFKLNSKLGYNVSKFVKNIIYLKKWNNIRLK